MKLFVHPDTQRTLDVYLRDAPHAVILTGKTGVGLATIAADFAKQSKAVVYTVLPEKDEKIDLEKGTITVQSVRRLYDLTKTIEPNGRVIIIDYAERMAAPAQNAFLKLLEEPIEGTRFMLLTHQLEVLLPTVLSRSQLLTVKPVSSELTNEILDELKVYDTTKRAQLTFIAGGLPSELTRLVRDEQYFTNRAQVVKDARQYITGTPYQKLLIAKHYKDSRKNALLLLEDAGKMVQNELITNADDGLMTVAGKIEKIHGSISANGNIRLQLSSIL